MRIVLVHTRVPPPSDYPESSWKLQTACSSSHAELQTRALDRKTRLDELYLVLGVLGGQKREIDPKMTPKPVYVKLRKYSSEYIPKCYGTPVGECGATLPSGAIDAIPP